MSGLPRRYDGPKGGSAGGPGTPLALLTFNPNPRQNKVAASAAFADVDAADLIVSFTVPASGRVLVRLTAWYGYNAGAAGFAYAWNLREGAANVPNSIMEVSFIDTVTQFRTAHTTRLITGLNPGDVHNWKWGHACSLANGAVMQIGVNSATEEEPATMEVWSA